MSEASFLGFFIYVYVHFLPTSARNEPKKRRQEGKVLQNSARGNEIFNLELVPSFLQSSPSLESPSLRARPWRAVGGVRFGVFVGWNRWSNWNGGVREGGLTGCRSGGIV